MSSVISVENLSKKYIIGHQKQERYALGSAHHAGPELVEVAGQSPTYILLPPGFGKRSNRS